MATLTDIRVTASRALKDPTNGIFSVAEVDDLINQGIDAVSDVAPRELVASLGTVSASVKSYDASDFDNIYRIDVYNTSGGLRYSVPLGTGDGPNTGWELHGGVIYFPPSHDLVPGDTIRAFGYARFTQLSAASQTTDLSTSLINAVVVFVQAEGFQRLMNDRVLFQQWQAQPGNTDVTGLAIGQMAGSKARRWDVEKARIRRLRKRG